MPESNAVLTELQVSLGKKSAKGTLVYEDPIAEIEGHDAFSSRPKLQFTP